MMLAATQPDPIAKFLQANAIWAVPLFMIAVWWLVLHWVAWVSGWSELARHYRATAPFEGTRWRFQSAQMRYLSHYNNILTFGVNGWGLYIAMWGPFSAGHAPLLVPRAELTVEPKRRFFIDGYELRFRQAPEVYMWIWRRLGDKILQASAEPNPLAAAPPPIG